MLGRSLRFRANRRDRPIAKAALVHAQFETIHPFVDGNGRTGRTLLHRMLRSDGVLLHATVPISAGLLHDIDDYMSALSCYQQGDPALLSNRFATQSTWPWSSGKRHRALSQACRRLDGAHARALRISHLRPTRTARRAARRQLRLRGKRLEITRRSATSIINRACEYGILKPLGNMRRGDFYQAPELISILDEISSMAGIRRLVAGA